MKRALVSVSDKTNLQVVQKKHWKTLESKRLVFLKLQGFRKSWMVVSKHCIRMFMVHCYV